MILKQGHTYKPMPHDGKTIWRIYRGGRCYYIASPYSLAATQALRAAFPQYWTAIRDYGVAHPQLVPFINEDPMLIVSLVEVGKTRWLDNGGTYAYIDTGLTTDKNCQYMKAYAKVQYFKTSGTYYFLANSTLNFKRTNKYADTNSFENWYEFKEAEPLEIYVLADPVNSKKGFGCNGREGLVNYNNVMANSYKIFLFALGTDILYSQTAERVTFAYAKIEKDGVMLREMYPFIRNGENGMLDILSGTFYPNANTEGAFTIEITDKA